MPAQRRAGGRKKTATPKIYAPIPGWGGTVAGAYHTFRPNPHPHYHSGVDIPVPRGTACVAPVDGKIGKAILHGFAPGEGGPDGQGGGMVHFIFPADVGGIKAGTVIGWGHIEALYVKEGDSVKAGQVIAKSGWTFTSADHVHFIARHDDDGLDGLGDGTFNPLPLLQALEKGSTVNTGQAGSGNSGGGGGGGTSSGDTEAIAKAAAFSTLLDLPGILDQQESLALRGNKSLMNDQPLLPFIEQLCKSSLRSFQSMPNGNFLAFFPDYFGGLNHRTPYWEIEDIEIIDASIELSDDALATHVYVVGDIARFDGQVDLFDKIQSSGVVTIFEAFAADFINGIQPPKTNAQGDNVVQGVSEVVDTAIDAVKDLTLPGGVPTFRNNKGGAIAFLKKYGARPHFEEAPFVRSPYFELFLAYQTFMLLWAQQFRTTFELTFMPELYPGGIVAFPDHGIQCYIAEVEHQCSYESGFKTTATMIAPAALTDSNGQPIDPARKNVHAGMIRAFSLGGDLPFDALKLQRGR
jgi:hypothetical protein